MKHLYLPTSGGKTSLPEFKNLEEFALCATDEELLLWVYYPITSGKQFDFLNDAPRVEDDVEDFTPEEMRMVFLFAHYEYPT